MLWSLFSASDKKKPRTLTPIPSAAGQRFLNELSINKLKSMPAQAAKAFELAHDPTADFTDFVSVIEIDEALTAKVLSLANSVYYCRGEACQTVEQAVATVGIEQLRCMLGATMLNGLVGSPHPVRSMIWANAIATALLAKRLAQGIAEIDASSAFLCGIMHDLGKLLMVEHEPEKYRKVVEKICYENLSVTEAEEEIYDLNHTELGQWVAEEWNFPKVAIKSIRWHHEELVENTNLETWHLIHIADTLCHVLAIGHEGPMKRIKERAEIALPHCAKALKLEESALSKTLESFQRDFASESEALMHFIK